MKKIITIIFLITFYYTYSQVDTIKPAWVPLGVAGLNLNQVALSNWTQGGESSVAWSIFGNFGLKYSGNGWIFDNRLKASFGMSKTGGNDFRNNDNEFYLEDVLSYNFGWKVDPFFSNSVRTILADGFDYTKVPNLKIASFFDPGYITQSLGFTYGKPENFASRLGIALQEIFTNKFRNFSDDPSTPDKIEAFKLETGIESVTDASAKLDDNLLYTTKLRLFSQFKSLDVWDVRWDNTITAKINKYMNVNLNVLVIYEKMQSPKTQTKEAMQFGLVFNIF